jgi:hypothetical protein
MKVESYKGYQIEPVSRGGNFQISKNGKHMATGNSLVDARLMIDLHENYLASAAACRQSHGSGGSAINVRAAQNPAW